MKKLLFALLMLLGISSITQAQTIAYEWDAAADTTKLPSTKKFNRAVLKGEAILVTTSALVKGTYFTAGDIIYAKKNRPTLVADFADILPVYYKEYVALLTQTGTSAPVATVLNANAPNYLGSITWTRGTGGPYMWYIATKASGTWANTKMVILIGNGTKISPSDEVTLVVTETSTTTIQFKPVLVKTPGADPYSDITNGRHPVSVTIRVYF